MSDSELAVLGAAIAEPELFELVADQLDVAIFRKHRELAWTIIGRYKDRLPITPESLQLSLAETELLASGSAFTADSIRHHTTVLQDRYLIREFESLGMILCDGPKARETPRDLLTRCKDRLAELEGAGNGSKGVRVKVPLEKVIRELHEPLRRGITMGIDAVDNLTGGFRPGQLIVLGGRPSMGKTALAIGVAREAIAADKTVLFLSYEMSTQQIVQRFLSNMSGIDLVRIITHRVREYESGRIVDAAAKLHQANLWIEDSNETNVSGICRELQRRQGLDLVIVDYLQLLSGNSGSREQDVAKISRDFKRLAREFKVPVLVLSQLNRELEKRSCKRPQLSDFRESGAIEQDADIALLLWRPGVYSDCEPDDTAELIVAKHRNGPTGLVELRWRKDHARFD